MNEGGDADARDAAPAPIATIADVAALARLSRMTVSRVVNGASNVAPATRAAVLESIRALNYVPNLPARDLAAGRSARIAILYSAEAGEIAPVLIGAVPVADANRMQLVPHRLEVRPGPAARLALRRLTQQAAGAILLLPGRNLHAVRRLLQRAAIPAVALAAERLAGLSCVRIDEFAAAYQMTVGLFSLGHRSIAFIDGNAGRWAASPRRLGFEAALRDYGRRIHTAVRVDTACSYRCGMRAADGILSSGTSITAIFASHDEIAAGASVAAQRRGLGVPAALSIVGFGDCAIASRTSPELTTVRVPLAAMATRAMELLVHAIRQHDSGDAVDSVVAHAIIHRESAAFPPGVPRRLARPAMPQPGDRLRGERDSAGGSHGLTSVVKTFT